MEFFTNTMMASSISESSRREVFGSSYGYKLYDLDCEPRFGSTMTSLHRLVVSTPLVSSLSTKTVEAIARGKEQNICHTWSSWDVTRGHVRVVIHIVEVDPKEDTESHTEFLDNVA